MTEMTLQIICGGGAYLTNNSRTNGHTYRGKKTGSLLKIWHQVETFKHLYQILEVLHEFGLRNSLLKDLKYRKRLKSQVHKKLKFYLSEEGQH